MKKALLLCAVSLGVALLARPGSAEPAIPDASALDNANLERGKADWKDMGPGEQADYLDQQPDVKDKVKERWEKATPAERAAFMKKHPRFGKEVLKKRWDDATPEERGAWLQEHL